MSTSPKKKELWITQSKRCWYCGKELPLHGAHLEHLTPKSKGGGNEATNLVLSCPSCNLQKGTMSLGEYREHVYWNQIFRMTRTEVEDLKRIIELDGWWNLQPPSPVVFFGERGRTP